MMFDRVIFCQQQDSKADPTINAKALELSRLLLDGDNEYNNKYDIYSKIVTANNGDGAIVGAAPAEDEYFKDLYCKDSKDLHFTGLNAGGGMTWHLDQWHMKSNQFLDFLEGPTSQLTMQNLTAIQDAANNIDVTEHELFATDFNYHASSDGSHYAFVIDNAQTKHLKLVKSMPAPVATTTAGVQSIADVRTLP